MSKKIIILIFLLIFLLLLSNNIFYEEDIDHLAYVIAIGIDKGEKEKLKISFQISIPESGSSDSGSSDSSSSKSKDTTITTVECSSLDSGINLANGYISKELNLSHCKILAISEELAKDGISDYIYTAINSIELRPNCNFIICKNSCMEFLEKSKPDLENLTAQYYEVATTASKYSSYTSDINIVDFFLNLTDTFGEACAILGSTSNKEKRGNLMAGETNIETSSRDSKDWNIEILGLAVFKGDKLVGELDGFETTAYLILTNKLKKSIIAIPDPNDNNKTIDLQIKLNKKTDNKVTLKGDFPYISSNVYISSNILSMSSKKNYLDEKELIKLENLANDYIKDLILKYFEKTSKKYNSDVAGIGKHAVKYFLIWDKWTDYNWLDKYKNAIFDVNVNTKVNSSYLLLKS